MQQCCIVEGSGELAFIRIFRIKIERNNSLVAMLLYCDNAFNRLSFRVSFNLTTFNNQRLLDQMETRMAIFFLAAICQFGSMALLMLSPLTGNSQTVPYRFKHINRGEGLSQSNVTSIVQDQKGFMWFGTRDGLNRYDGYKITVYKNDAADSKSISHNYIRALYLDRTGRLWIGTEDGLNLYHCESDTFLNYKQTTPGSERPGSNKIKAIYEDSKGNLWVGTGIGLKRFDVKSHTFAAYLHPGAALPPITDDIEDIVEDQAGNLWIATWNAGLILLNGEENEMRRFRYNHGDPSSLSADYLKKLFIDRANNLWIGTTEGGLNLYNPETQNFTRHQHLPQKLNTLNNNDVLSIAEDDDGNLWIGTQNGGINILNRDTHTFSYVEYDERYPEGLNSGSVYTIYKDAQGNMWVGTFSGGINYWSALHPKFDHLKKNRNGAGLNNNNVLAIYEDKDGKVLLATDGGGLNIYDKRTKTVEYLLHDQRDKSSISSNYPLCIYEDREKNIWVGGFYGKPAIYDMEKKAFRHVELGVDVNHIATICEDVTGKMWLGTWGQGVVVFDKLTGTVKQYLPDPAKEGSISHNIIFSIHEDRKGNVWIGTEGGGLNLYNRTTDDFTHFRYDHHVQGSISNNIVNAIYEDAKGRLWVGTSGGLNHVDRGQKFTVYAKSDGMQNEVIHAIVEDDCGNLWLSTNNGITRFDPEKKKFRNYGTSDGLQGNSFNRLASYKNGKGEIYFGGINGLNYFHPDSITDNDRIPPVYFTELQIFNKPVSAGQENTPLEKPIEETTELTLSYKQSVFSVEFVALNYTSPEQNQYAYKLEGFDQDWNYVDTQRKATYTNLDPGEYVLRVMASNNDGVWNTQGASMKITILAPFWKTGWAKSFYIVMAVVFLFILRAVIIQRMKVKNRLEMDEIKLRFYANISHEFRTPLTLILGPLNQLNTVACTWDPENRKLLQLMHKNGQRLHKLINQLMHIYELDAGFTKLKVATDDVVAFCRTLKEAFQYQAEKKRIRYEFVTAVEQVYVFFDHDKLEKILLNLLSNAFKYTPEGGSIKVELILHKHDLSNVPPHLLKTKRGKAFVSLMIQDSGEGIPLDSQPKIFDRFYRVENKHWPKEGTGLGLSLARQLAISHHGDIVLKSEPGKGSTFTVWLPVNREVFDQHEVEAILHDSPGKFSDFHQIRDFREAKESHVFAPGPNPLPVLLMVEDNYEIRAYVKHHLGTAFHVEEAANGREGLKIAFDIIPDIIVSDIMMPEIDGIEMTATLKKDLRTSHIPVVLLTARADESVQLGAFTNSMADDYVTKPFNLPVLLAKLRNMIALRENLKKKLYASFMASPHIPTIPSMDEDFLKKAVAVVERNMDDCEFNVERFSRELGMSQTNLYRKLQNVLGISGNQFIKDIRMKRAVQLLTSKQYSIGEIAEKVGFADAKYFSQSFKKQFKVLPTAFSETRQVAKN